MVKNKKEDLMERRRCGIYNLKFSYSSKMQRLLTVVVLDFVFVPRAIAKEYKFSFGKYNHLLFLISLIQSGRN